MKICSRCKQLKSLDEFPNSKQNSSGKNSWCKSCYNQKSNEYYHSHKEQIRNSFLKNYEKNKDKILFRTSRYQKEHKDKVNEWSRNRNKKLRETFISMYGGKCECCGETESVFLTIDHINGQIGRKKKETGETAYRKAIKNYNPKEFRVLCMNCNSAVRFGRTCPHQKEK